MNTVANAHELVDVLTRVPGESKVRINFPNDDQDWPAYIVIALPSGEEEEIYLG